MRARSRLQQALALSLLAGKLAGTANRLGTLARALFRGFLVVLAKLHFAKDALALKLFLERAQRLIDIVVANGDLHVGVIAFLN